MTPEKILELLPKVKKAHTYASENANEYICYEYGYIDARNDCANALAGKVVAKEDLLTPNDVVQILVKLHNRNFPESNVKHEYKETCSCINCYLGGAFVEAQQRKANRGEV
jgi:hypothetical protein